MNISNRGALFGYLGWRDPIADLAPYNIESAAAERQVVAKLDGAKPRYALIGPGPQNDGLSLSLRNPLLAHWVMRNYTPMQCGSFVWATLGTRPDASGAGALRCPQATARAGRAADVAALWSAGIGAPTDLDLIPASWGARASDLGGQRFVATRSGADGPSGQKFALGLPAHLAGAHDLLVLTATCPSNPRAKSPSSVNRTELRASLTWGAPDTSGGISASTFEWGAGRLVVPVDSYPTWPTNRAVPRGIALSVPTLDCAGGWALQASLVPRP